MKVYSSKFNDEFYLPIVNNSCRDELGYQVTVNDTYGLLSIENTVGPGPRRDVYVTVPKVPSIPISQGTLYAKAGQNGEYYLEVAVQNQLFESYEPGKSFYIFYSDGSYSDISVDFFGYDGEFPNFLINQSSLKKLIGTLPLPTEQSPVLLNSPYSISTDYETRNFLKVSTSTRVKGTQTASIILRGLRTDQQAITYEFVIDPVDSPVQKIDQPPIGLKTTETQQLARSFIPISSVISLQVDSTGGLYMDKISSGSSNSQTGYRRRCTNLGFEKDLSRFCASIPKPSLYSFSEDDFRTSTNDFSEQYFTGVNAGIRINRETEEGFRAFAPLWIKDRIPSYFAIFRKSPTDPNASLLEGASLVKLVDIQKTELGPYLNRLMESDSFKKAPLEVSIDQSYSLRWNGVSVETGTWTTHTEFMGIDIQEGLSDFEFNEVLSGGFSRGLIINPQFLNIEFLFDDKESMIYDINQYFGLYCDDVELTKFLPNIESTARLFTQNESRGTSSSDFNSSVLSNPSGVKIAVDLNETPDRSFSVTDPNIMIVGSNVVSSRYPISILPTTQSSRNFSVSFTSDVDISQSLGAGKTVRLEDENRNFISYLTVSTSTYSPSQKKMTVKFAETDTYSSLRLSYWINMFDSTPDVSPSIPGGMRFDCNDVSKSKCIVFSTMDLTGSPITEWLGSVVDQSSEFRDSLVLFDKSTSSYAILLANTVLADVGYVKVFFDVLESNGSFLSGDEVFINLSEFDVDGAVPSPKLVSSGGRKFILKTKDDSYSVKDFDLTNYKNSVVGIISLDSTTFNLGSITGTKSISSIPVQEKRLPYLGASVRFAPTGENSILYGDRITVEEVVGKSKKRWTVIRSQQNGPHVSFIPGATTEILVESGSLKTNDSYTELEIEQGSYFPVPYDEFELIGSTSGRGDIRLTFVSAEQLESGNYLLTFSNTNIETDYTAIRIRTVETNVTYFDLSPSDSLETTVAVAFQRFTDCPLRSAVGFSMLHLYSPTIVQNVSVHLYMPYGTLTQMEINRSPLKPVILKKDGLDITSNTFIHRIESMGSESVYSIETSFLSNLQEGTSVLSKSGTPLVTSKWNNGSYGTPDIRSIVENGEDRDLVKFSSGGTPSLLNGRLQIIGRSIVAMSMLSFYGLIDLNFFEEVPVRLDSSDNGRNVQINPGSSIFSQRVQTVQSIGSALASTNQKTITVSIDISENIYSDWKNWDPANNPDFLAYGTPKGTISESGSLPITWNPSYGFKIQYLDKLGKWNDYDVTYPTIRMNTPLVKNYSINRISDPMWQIVFSDPSLYPEYNPSFGDVQTIVDDLILYMYTSSFDERLRAFYELKRLVSYCFRSLSAEQLDMSSDVATYVYSHILAIDDEHLDYRYIATFPEGTYRVTENNTPIQVGGDIEQTKKISGVPKENIISNFATSIVSGSNKTRMTSGRWKRRNSTNVDYTPYLMNVDPLLLPYDMFVNGTETSLSSISFPIDWYLISGWPTFGGLKGVENNYQYIGRRLDIDSLRSVQYDFFSDALTVGHGDEAFIDGSEREKRFLWSIIESGPKGYTTVFKGAPFVFTSPKVDLTGAKFAAILQVDKSIETSSKITLLYNQQWHTLTLFVQVNIDSYFIDGSIGLEQLYQLKANSARTNTGTLYGPMIIDGSDLLLFDRVNRAYNKRVDIVTNTPILLEDYYEYNRYQYNTQTEIRYSQIEKDIELFGIDYHPNVDYVISGTIFFGTRNQTNIELVIPRSRIRGVFDPSIGKKRTFIDGIYGDDFFGVISDVDGAPIATYATFVSQNMIRISGTVLVSNSYYPGSSSVDVDADTFIHNARISVIGDSPVYRKTVNEITLSSIIKRVSSYDFDDVMISPGSDQSRTNMALSYMAPSVIRPSKTKTAVINEFGIVKIENTENSLNLFRIDGGFEPSYKNIISFAASEDPLITKQMLNSFRGYNTHILRVNDITLWYRRVSQDGVSSGSINVNGNMLHVPYAIGRRNISPLTNVWGNGFYSKAIDVFIDDPVDGLNDFGDMAFFLSSKAMSIPSFFRTTTYSTADFSISGDNQQSAVSYMSSGSRLSIQIDFERIISEHLLNAGVLSFFSSIWESIGTKITPYELSGEYIRRNLLDRYAVQSIDVYQKESLIPGVVSISGSLDGEGFSYVNTIGIEEPRSFDFSIPLDGSKQIVLAFNIKRR